VTGSCIVVVKGVDAKLLVEFENLGIFEEVSGGPGWACKKI